MSPCQLLRNVVFWNCEDMDINKLIFALNVFYQAVDVFVFVETKGKLQDTFAAAFADTCTYQYVRDFACFESAAVFSTPGLLCTASGGLGIVYNKRLTCTLLVEDPLGFFQAFRISSPGIDECILLVNIYIPP